MSKKEKPDAANPRKPRKEKVTIAHPVKQATPSRSAKGRVLVEFSDSLLKRTDDAAQKLDSNRSEFIRSAVEQYIAELDAREFERELAEGYAANAEMNLALADEFSIVDSEGL
jgi:predicted transcriptional regulator